MTKHHSIVLAPNAEVIEASGVGGLLTRIRPHWQAKQLIQRVNRLLPTDPSSACQRIFNASIHDLKEKIVVAGLDIATEAAKQHRLPPISKAEDVEAYSVSRTIELAYRMGLLSRPEFKRLARAYDIRKDLEHEDDEYEAGVEDCVYIFSTCIEVVLSRDPVHLIKLTDIKDIVEQPSATVPNEALVEEYRHAPQPRQHEIFRFLISNALNKKQPDIVRQNSYNALYALKEHTQNQVILDCATEMIEQIGKHAPSMEVARVAVAAGTFPYLKRAQVRELFNEYFEKMRQVGYQWGSFRSHGELLRNLGEIGGLDYCPDEALVQYVEWLVLCYIGEPGGYGLGVNRKVFSSNTGAPLALKLITGTSRDISAIVADLEKKSKDVRSALGSEHVARRYHSILDSLDK
jgi:hypothetical protein